jgi:hypothetical protein
MALGTLRENVHQARQYFVVHYAFFDALKHDQPLEDRLNEYPLFWNLTLNSWQAALFTCLGRIFDNDGYGLKRILREARKRRSMFAPAALERRKQMSGLKEDRLRDYMAGKTDLSGSYLDQLAEQVDSYREMYDRACQHVRSKVYAHSVLLTPADRAKAFSKLSESEVFTLIAFSVQMEKALLQLFENGREMKLPLELPEPPSIFNPPLSNNSWQVPDLDGWGLADKVVELLVGIRDMPRQNLNESNTELS